MPDPADRSPVLRFAPSPNGRLHLGHALSALITFDLARQLGGRFLLRIEDIDPARTTQDYINGIVDDLEWLGLTWESPIVFQSTRFEHYRNAATALGALGVTYSCAATRNQRAAKLDPARTDPDGAPLYRPICGRAVAGGPLPPCAMPGADLAIRLDTAAALRRIVGPLTYVAWDGADAFETRTATPEIWGDPILVRKDTPTSYHLAVVVDDAHQGVTHVTRGQDLEAATDLHVLLQRLLGLPTPVYHHHRLITDPDGRKLSKSARDASLSDLRNAGTTPTEIRRLVGL